VPYDEIETLFQELCKRRGYAASSLREVATVSLKADEPGLREFAARHGVPLRGFTVNELSQVAGLPTPSAQVQAKIGIAGVAEPAAMLAAGASNLLVPKYRGKRVTMALARKENP
jgi:cobalt-precorrin 5A hydrolase